jgi:hypothetical protein
MAKTTVTGDAARPKSIDTLASITEQALAFRYPDRSPTFSDVARLVNTASRLLRFSDVDHRIEVENAVTLVVAKKLQLVS